jgi:hypothetical protein
MAETSLDDQASGLKLRLFNLGAIIKDSQASGLILFPDPQLLSVDDLMVYVTGRSSESPGKQSVKKSLKSKPLKSKKGKPS